MRFSHTTSRPNRPAFSIIELTLVLAIIAVVAGIALPRYGRAIASYRASAAAQRIVADIALAQTTARATSSSVTIVYTPGGSYTIDGIRDLETGSNTYTVSLAGEPYLAEITNVDSSTYTPASKSDPSVRLTFDGYGTADGNVGIVVVSGSF